MNGPIASTLRKSASVLIVFGAMAYVYGWFHKYDWGHPLIKLFCFAVLFFLIVVLRIRAGRDVSAFAFTGFEAVLWTTVLLIIIARYVKTYGPDLWHPPYVDIGYSTVNAAKALFHDGANPYSLQTIDVHSDLPTKYHGYPYGPFMLLGYAPSLFSFAAGYKFTTLAYLLLSAAMLVLLSQKDEVKWTDKLATAAFAMCLFFLPERFWYELFHQGANDMFPVTLVLGSLVGFVWKRYFACGILLGLSVSAKFLPALALLIPFVRKDFRPAIFWGFVIGLIPLFVFAIWDPPSLFYNVFWNRLTLLQFDATSLYSVLPRTWHFLPPVLLLVATGLAVWRNFFRPLEFENVLVTATLLLIVAEVTSKQMHTNHLIWFYPLLALILARGRHQLLALRQRSTNSAGRDGLKRRGKCDFYRTDYDLRGPSRPPNTLNLQ